MTEEKYDAQTLRYGRETGQRCNPRLTTLTTARWREYLQLRANDVRRTDTESHRGQSLYGNGRHISQKIMGGATHMKPNEHDHAGLHEILTSEGPTYRQDYADLRDPPHDYVSRIYAWVKYRGRRERGDWCICTLHNRLLVLLNLAEIEYVVRGTQVKFTIPTHNVSKSIYQLEVWWMRVNAGL